MPLWLLKVGKFFTTDIGIFVVLSIAVLGGLGVWSHSRYSAGYKAGETAGKDASIADYRKAYIAAQTAVLKREKDAAKITGDSRQDLGKAQGKIEQHFGELKEKVPRYVPAKSDAGCVVPNGFVSLWNKGAAGPRGSAAAGFPRSSGGPVEAASGVPLSDVLTATLSDFEIAYVWNAEALTWRKWYVDQKAAYEAPD